MRRKHLDILFFLAPLAGAALLFAWNKDLSIPTLHLTIPGRGVAYGCVGLLILWMLISPAKKCCCDGSRYELFWFCFPLSVCTTLYFAEGSLGILLAIVAIMACLPYAVYRLFRLSPGENAQKAMKEYGQQWLYHRLFVRASFWIMLIGPTTYLVVDQVRAVCS